MKEKEKTLKKRYFMSFSCGPHHRKDSGGICTKEFSKTIQKTLQN